MPASVAVEIVVVLPITIRAAVGCQPIHAVVGVRAPAKSDDVAVVVAKKSAVDLRAAHQLQWLVVVIEHHQEDADAKRTPGDVKQAAAGIGVKISLFEMYTKKPSLALSKGELMAALPGRKWASITV